VTTKRTKDDNPPPQKYDGGGRIIAKFKTDAGPDWDEVWRMHTSASSSRHEQQSERAVNRKPFQLKRRGFR
jgi:hypothetical protein